MAWIEFHEALRDHWKIGRLAAELKMSYAEALGSLALLWLWAVSNAPTGSLKGFSDDEIRRAMRITKSKLNVKQPLVNCGLVDKDMKIHDWHKHGVSYLKSHRSRQKKYREKRHHGDITVTSPLRIYQTNQTRPDQPNTNTVSQPAKNLLATAFPNLNLNPKSIDLRDTVVEANGVTLGEAAKHKLYNRLIPLFQTRGWEPKLIKSVMMTCAARLKVAKFEGDIYPYYEKIIAKYINENSELINSKNKEALSENKRDVKRINQ